MGPLTGGSYELCKSSTKSSRCVLPHLWQTVVQQLHTSGVGRGVLRNLPGRARFGDRAASFSIYRTNGGTTNGELWSKPGVGRTVGRDSLWRRRGLQRPIREGTGAPRNFHSARGRSRQRS